MLHSPRGKATWGLNAGKKVGLNIGRISPRKVCVRFADRNRNLDLLIGLRIKKGDLLLVSIGHP